MVIYLTVPCFEEQKGTTFPDLGSCLTAGFLLWKQVLGFKLQTLSPPSQMKHMVIIELSFCFLFFPFLFVCACACNCVCACGKERVGKFPRPVCLREFLSEFSPVGNFSDKMQLCSSVLNILVWLHNTSDFLDGYLIFCKVECTKSPQIQVHGRSSIWRIPLEILRQYIGDISQTYRKNSPLPFFIYEIYPPMVWVFMEIGFMHFSRV